jgi:hypothetical protein
MEQKKIKGILGLDIGESLELDKAIKTGDSIGIQMSAEWEGDTVRLFLVDKKGDGIGSIEFDNTDFQGLMGDVMPPLVDEANDVYDKLSAKEKKELQEEADEILRHPIKDIINKLHR